ncbi:inner membrane protein yeeR, partial [Escherichia coli UMEA 3292-1]
MLQTALALRLPLIALQYDISPSLMWWGGLLYWLAALVTLLW